MELVKQSVNVELVGGFGFSTSLGMEGKQILHHLERAGRLCYKSEEKIGDFEKTKKFIRGLITSGHHSVLEHVSITARFISNRGMTHELVRHRLASYSQESTRYCNYGNDHVKFIIPTWAFNLKPGVVTDKGDRGSTELSVKIDEWHPNQDEIIWLGHMLRSESVYKTLVKFQEPQFARGVLPIDLKTEILMTANLREWRHVFSLRCSKVAHPQIRELLLELLDTFHKNIPVLFDDIVEEFYEIRDDGELALKE